MCYCALRYRRKAVLGRVPVINTEETATQGCVRASIVFCAGIVSTTSKRLIACLLGAAACRPDSGVPVATKEVLVRWHVDRQVSTHATIRFWVMPLGTVIFLSVVQF